MLPIRRPGEGRGPVTLTIFKSLGPGLRRDDGSYSDLRKTKKSSLDSNALSRE